MKITLILITLALALTGCGSSSNYVDYSDRIEELREEYELERTETIGYRRVRDYEKRIEKERLKREKMAEDS